MKKLKVLLLYCCIVLLAVLLYLHFMKNTEMEPENFYNRILVHDSRLGEVLLEEKDMEFIPTFQNIGEIQTMEDIKKYLFSIDSSAYVKEEDLPIIELADMDLRTEVTGPEPKILIFHTHSQEDFIDSEPGNPEESIVGVGRYLSLILAEEYGVNVVHDVGQYDIVDGKLQRGTSYESMEPAAQKILEKYPSIEVTIDLHRDGVPDNVHLVTEYEGKPCAKIMFFNGITRYNRNGEPVEMPELQNPYIKENLALSLQMFLTANETYPGLARKTYIKPYRYSLHLKERSMLVEVGANTNTLEEAMNAMVPLADIIMKVLDSDGIN